MIVTIVAYGNPDHQRIIKQKEEENKLGENSKNKSFLSRVRDNWFWILFVMIAWYLFIGGVLAAPFDMVIETLQGTVSNGMYFTLQYYSTTIIFVITLYVLTWVFKDNRYIWKSFLLPSRKGNLEPSGMLDADDIRAELYGRSRNSFRMLGIGLLLGFLTNFFCILLALIHGDIKLYFDASLSQLPFFLFALLCVCIQSSSEELWCRGFLYERLHKRYPLWVSIVINGVLFGFLHIFNDSVSVIPILSITICGISYSLLRWYTGNIWIAMGIHTGWNFTQNFLFGLPNSGLVSESSLFHLDAATGISNLIYDYGFGVEGGLPAVFIDTLLAVVVLVLASKAGRLGELRLNRWQTLELKGITIEE